MVSLSEQLHFVLFPFMAQGHLIPMVDIGRLLAQRGVIVTIVTTPLNADRVQTTVSRMAESGQPIRLEKLQFPCKDVGLPEGCENIDLLSSKDDFFKFYDAVNKMEEPASKLFRTLAPRPNCIISDMNLIYTNKIAAKFKIPRISFHGFCCLSLLCVHKLHSSKMLDYIASDSEYFVVPDIPYEVEFTKAQLPLYHDESFNKIFGPIKEAETEAYGVVINTFEELESPFVKEYKKVRNDKAWCIGPVSLSYNDDSDKVQRGNMASINEHQCLKWLDSQQPRSVIYACLGSVSSLKLSHLKELGLGLEASNKPFIWVVRGNNTSHEVEDWMKEDGFLERTKGKGLVILGWAPQVLILSHPAIGGFLTHCGWNSTLEGVSVGVPLITWPLVGDQFSDEKLVVQVLKIGISLGVQKPMFFEDEMDGMMVKKEDVKNAVDKLMDNGNEATERRRKAKEFGDKAKKAVEVGGSSYLNMTLLIQDIRQQSHKNVSGFGSRED